MRRRNAPKRRGGSDGSFWLSFSDLMSTLVLIFILIMFYSMYQYFDMFEVKEAELARRQFDLDSANEQLAEEQEKLTAAEQAMIAQQIKLQAAEAGLAETEDILAKQQQELDAAKALLGEKESQLGNLSDQLTRQQEALENQQLQLEALTGMRTKIVVALSEALKSSNISATVDPTTGAIALESDVLFDTGNSTLSEAGQRSIDAFLPVYLNVLLSDEYRPYISEIIIEGHTSSEGGYIMNLELSQQRALAVASYILDDSYRVISNAQKATLREITTANGRSYSDRIMVNGVEDREASRRVVFKFRLTDEQMIEQMKLILEQNAAMQEEAAATEQPAQAPEETPAPAP